ncbi:hypothetical protein KJ966_06810 [bacterium]|nr:hypothetical protein [bacterium]
MQIETNIKNRDRLIVTLDLDNGNKEEFNLFMGDAALKGNPESVWLKSTRDSKGKYLRKLPVKPMTVGVALFNSFQELMDTLKSGNYYIA